MLLALFGCEKKPDPLEVAPEAEPAIEPETTPPEQNTIAAPKVDLNREFEYTLGEVLIAYKRAEEIKEESAMLLQDLKPERVGLYEAIKAFARGPTLDSELGHSLRRQDGYQKKLAEHQEEGNPEKIREYTWKSKNQALFIEVLRMQDPEQRTQRKQALESRLEELEATIQEVSAPYDARIQSLRKEVAHLKAPVREGIESRLRTPEGIVPSLKMRPLLVNPDQAFFVAKWVDGQGKQVASAHILLSDEAETEPLKGLYLEQYPYSLWSDTSMFLRVGYFDIRFSVRNKDLGGNEKIARLLEQFFDLERFANLTPRNRKNEVQTATNL